MLTFKDTPKAYAVYSRSICILHILIKNTHKWQWMDLILEVWKILAGNDIGWANVNMILIGHYQIIHLIKKLQDTNSPTNGLVI